MAACTELLDHGVRVDQVHQRLYQSEPARRIKLLGAMLGTLELFDDDRLAVLHITQAMFRQCGATPHDTEDLINEPQLIGSVNVTALLVEEDDGRIRLSVRSKHDVDVAAVARSFGGGGHAKAAGARSVRPLAETRQEVITAMRKVMAG